MKYMREPTAGRLSGLPGLPEAQEWRPFAPEYHQAMHIQRRKAKNDVAVTVAIILGLVLISLVTGSIALAGLAVLVLGPFWVIYRAYVWDLRRGSTAGDELLVADLQQAEDILVEVFYEVNGVVTGRDRGVVWVDPTGFCFYGHRSWFRIAQVDLMFPDRKGFFSIPNELEAYKDLTMIAIGHQRRKINIGIREIAREEEIWNTYFARKRVGDQIERFLAQDASSNLPTQLPPLGLDPQGRVLRGLAVRPSEIWAAVTGLMLQGAAIPAFYAFPMDGDAYLVVLWLIGCKLLMTPVRRALSLCRGRYVRAGMAVRRARSNEPQRLSLG